MHNRFLCVFFLIMLVPVVFSGQCRTTSQCACGEICVGSSNDVCGSGERCMCTRGCAVGNIFIPVGSRKNAYCNSCNCMAGPASSGTIPACTRRAWCNLPKNANLYPGKSNCQ